MNEGKRYYMYMLISLFDICRSRITGVRQVTATDIRRLKMTFAPSEYSDRLTRPLSLSKVFAAVMVDFDQTGPILLFCHEGPHKLLDIDRRRPGTEVLKLFSCSAQLSMEFIMLIHVKISTIVGILIFMIMINTTSEHLIAKKILIF